MIPSNTVIAVRTLMVWTLREGPFLSYGRKTTPAKSSIEWLLREESIRRQLFAPELNIHKYAYKVKNATGCK